MSDAQTTIPTAPPVEDPDLAGSPGANIDAHMPPQPGDTADVNPVFAQPVWNPDTNEWAPSNEQHSTFGVAEPSHGDVATAMPMSDEQGHGDGGSVPDARLNLLDAVRQGPTQLPAPVVEHHHVVDVQEQPSARVRLRTIAVVGNSTPTVLLEENPDRDRALIHVLTTPNTAILISPLRQGGLPALTAVPTTPGAFWVLQTNDQSIEFKSTAGLECVGITASSVCLVMVLEEMKATAPGLGV